VSCPAATKRNEQGIYEVVHYKDVWGTSAGSGAAGPSEILVLT